MYIYTLRAPKKFNIPDCSRRGVSQMLKTGREKLFNVTINKYARRPPSPPPPVSSVGSLLARSLSLGFGRAPALAAACALEIPSRAGAAALGFAFYPTWNVIGSVAEFTATRFESIRVYDFDD